MHHDPEPSRQSHPNPIRAARAVVRPGAAPLAADREAELLRRYRAGDRAAGDALVQALRPFVVSIALEYRRWGASAEDLQQEAFIGLLKAMDRFDPARGCRLVTYAAYWIRAEIREFVVRGYRIVRLGSSKSERRALRAYRRTRERDPDSLAAASGLTPTRAAVLLPLLMAADVSLDRPLEGGGTAGDVLPSPAPSPENEVADADERRRVDRALHRALAELGDRDRVILRCRYFADEPRTLEDLGHEFGISKERVRQLEERAKRKVGERLASLQA